MIGDLDELAALVDAAGEADPDPDAAAGETTEPMIVFRTASRWYGVNAEQVCEVVAHEHVSRVPAVPAHIIGVALVHSRLVPVVDLPALIGAATPPMEDHRRLVVVGTKGAEVSVIAEEARGVVEVSTPSADGAEPTAPFVRGEVRWDERLVCVLDGDALAAIAGQESEW